MRINPNVVYTVGERVFAMDLQTWNTEDLGPVIAMSGHADHADGHHGQIMAMMTMKKSYLVRNKLASSKLRSSQANKLAS